MSGRFVYVPATCIVLHHKVGIQLQLSQVLLSGCDVDILLLHTRCCTVLFGWHLAEGDLLP